MKSYDVRNNVFEMVDEVLSEVIPVYIHEFNELNIAVDYIHLDNIVQNGLKFDMKQRCIWYMSLEDVAKELFKTHYISEEEYEEIMMYCRFGIKPDLSED